MEKAFLILFTTQLDSSHAANMATFIKEEFDIEYHGKYKFLFTSKDITAFGVLLVTTELKGIIIDHLSLGRLFRKDRKQTSSPFHRGKDSFVMIEVDNNHLGNGFSNAMTWLSHHHPQKPESE